MDYQKIALKLNPDNQDFRDVLIAMLSNVGFESFVENEETVEAFIPAKLFKKELIEDLDIHPLFSIIYEHELIKDQNWNEVWEKNYFQPIIVANQCVVRAPFHKEYPKALYEIVIEPKMAFGTGNHETTALMIEYILELEIRGKQVLDMGCGTGILAMLASLKNALSIIAIDIDQWSVESTVENAAINNCMNIQVLHGDAQLLSKQKFDLIFANIHKNILIEDLPKYASVLNREGIVLLSGFYENDLIDIEKSARKLHLTLLEKRMKNKWVAAKFQKR